MRAVYEGIEYFKCEVCNIAFSEEIKLITHIKDVHVYQQNSRITTSKMHGL